MQRATAAQKLMDIIEMQNRKGFSPSTVFCEILDYFMHLLSLHSIPLPIERDYYPQLHKAIEFCEPFEDMLGDLYMEIHSRWKQSAMGQFFTPEPIADMMAQIVISKDSINSDTPLRLAEPCCGSGVMVLKTAKALQQYKHRHKWYCSDLDLICVKMTAVQCALNVIPAYIMHMNSLTLEKFRGYEVQLFWYGGWLPRLRQLSDAELKIFTSSPLGSQLKEEAKKQEENKQASDQKASVVQNSLFDNLEAIEQLNKQSKTTKEKGKSQEPPKLLDLFS